MTYEQMLEKLYNLKGSGLDLPAVLTQLDNPQDKFKSIRVGGTNGKGSTSVFLAQILQESGYCVGLFTSPHLIEPEERIQINSEKISREDFHKNFEQVWHLIEQSNGSQSAARARFFEVLVAMALDYFAQKKVEIAVIEAGVGGRRDATSVVRPILSLLTSVDFDHQEVLGETLEVIAQEKAGIAPPGVTLLTAEEKPEALSVIERVCESQNSVLARVDFSRLKPKRSDWDGQCFDWGPLKNLETKMPGLYQLRNVATALAAIELLNGQDLSINERVIRQGLKKACWPGRMELLHQRPYVLLDGAKNPAGLGALRKSLDALEFENLILILGIATRKEIPKMVREIVPAASHIIVTQASFRGSDSELIAREIQQYKNKCEVIPTPASALERALSIAGVNDLICVTGSLFLVGEARSLWQSRRFAKAEKIG